MQKESIWFPSIILICLLGIITNDEILADPVKESWQKIIPPYDTVKSSNGTRHDINQIKMQVDAKVILIFINAVALVG